MQFVVLSYQLTDFKFLMFWSNLKKNIVKIYSVWYEAFLLSKDFFFKKVLYTVNHKRIGINYLYFTYCTASVGAYLATCIRLELAYPGSTIFGGDSLKYLQVISVHALIMIFFVVVPIFFGAFANFLIPHHCGAKDVAFPRLNSLGFWIQPCGFILLYRVVTLRADFISERVHRGYLVNFGRRLTKPQSFVFDELRNDFYTLINRENLNITFNKFLKKVQSYKIAFGGDIQQFGEAGWIFARDALKIKVKKRYYVKVSNSTQTVAGWTFITPLSSHLKFTGWGVQDMFIIAVYFVGISTTITVANLLITRRVLSVSGLRSRRVLLPFTSISILLMLRTLSIITPILGAAMLMLYSDRHWRTSYFDFSYGGDPIFFQHLFWFFGHPEVYVLIIPAFGIINSILPTISQRRLASKHHLIWAVYVMNYMGFLVWGHHMYLIGLDHRSRALYSTITVMISLPATVKMVNWVHTLINGNIKNTLMLHIIVSFILFFIVAGITGMWLSHVSLNISMHDTLYVVAHFHLMLSGAVFMGIFAGYYHYFGVFFQIKYSRFFSLVHIVYYIIGQWLTFLPLFWLAFSGMPRRVHDFPFIYTGWQTVSTMGHFITLIGVFAFYALIMESAMEKKLITQTYSLVPRTSSRKTYFLSKILSIHIAQQTKNYTPNRNVRIFLHTYLHN